MADSPANTGINRLLHVVNNPFGFLGGGRAAVEAGSSSEYEEDEAAHLLASAKNVASTAQNSVETPKTAPNSGGVATISASTATKDDDSMADDNRKPAARTAKKPRKRVSVNDEVDVVPPSVDPPRAAFRNPYELEYAADEEFNDTTEYDSDGWEGPQRGIDPAELEAVQEEALPERSANDNIETAVGGTAATTHNEEVQSAPVHIPIRQRPQPDRIDYPGMY